MANRLRIDKIQEVVTNLIRNQTPPISVEQIAHEQLIETKRKPFDGHLCAVTHLKTVRSQIGINGSMPRQRQRFAIAHALGHICLHADDLYIDRAYNLLADDILEREANLFAMELLMSTKFFNVDQSALDMEDSTEIARLAKKFDVSEYMATLRVIHLTSWHI